MTKLTATRDFKYQTRRLLAGDTFDARNDTEAMILTRVRRVAEVAKPRAAKRGIPTVEEVLSAEVVDDMKALRAEYRKKFGKGPGPSWDAATIRAKIASA